MVYASRAAPKGAQYSTATEPVDDASSGVIATRLNSGCTVEVRSRAAAAGVLRWFARVGAAGQGAGTAQVPPVSARRSAATQLPKTPRRMHAHYGAEMQVDVWLLHADEAQSLSAVQLSPGPRPWQVELPSASVTQCSVPHSPSREQESVR